MPTTPRTTIRAVAQRAGVSRQTVSNALNSPERLDPTTLKRVLSVIRELDYRPDQAARTLSSQSTRLIGFRVGATPHNPMSNSDPLLRRLVASAASHGYQFIVFDADPDGHSEIHAFADLFGRRVVDGFVIADTLPSDPRPAWLSDRNIPFVAFGRPWGEPRAAHSWIDVDGARGIGMAVDHLVSLGHTRIGFIGWGRDQAGGDDRRRGWRSALRRHGLTSAGLSATAADNLDSGFVTATRFIATASPTAIVCASDVLALGTQRAVTGFGAYGRIAVTGFDDTPLAALARPTLSSLRQPLDDIADAIVQDLIDQCEGRGQRLSRIVAPELIVRESTATIAPTTDPGDARG